MDQVCCKIVRVKMPVFTDTFTWVKGFRIIPEFRILRLTFHRKSASNAEFCRYNYSVSDLVSVFLKVFDYLIWEFFNILEAYSIF